jgi:hypothetical protein
MRLGAWLFAIRPEEGAATSIYLATAPEVQAVTGEYFEKRKPVPASKAARDEAIARTLWEVSAAMTGLPADAPT